MFTQTWTTFWDIVHELMNINGILHSHLSTFCMMIRILLLSMQELYMVRSWENLLCGMLSFSFCLLVFLIVVIDLFNNNKTFTGISNSAGTVAAIISTIGTGYFVQWLGSFQAFLTVTAGLYIVTTIFWNLFATSDQVLWPFPLKKSSFFRIGHQKQGKLWIQKVTIYNKSMYENQFSTLLSYINKNCINP